MKTSKAEVDDHVQMQQFLAFFRQINRGEFLSEMGETLRDTNDKLSSIAARGSKAKGVVTITLAITHEESGLVTVQPDLKVKLPPTVRAKAVFWADADGTLVNKDPRQTELPLREVQRQAPAREVIDEPKPARSVQ